MRKNLPELNKAHCYMFIPLKHKSLDIYQVVRALVKEVYKVSKALPPEEKLNMFQQVRRAALSVKLNLAEGSTRRSDVERKRYLEISRGSIVEMDAAFETAVDLAYYSLHELEDLSELLNKWLTSDYPCLTSDVSRLTKPNIKTLTP